MIFHLRIISYRTHSLLAHHPHHHTLFVPNDDPAKVVIETAKLAGLTGLHGKLKSKRNKDLETVRAEPEITAVSHKAAVIHINESLTLYKKCLFGKVLKFKRRFNYKYAWTTNGTIMIGETDSSSSHSFTTFEQVEDFIDSILQY